MCSDNETPFTLPEPISVDDDVTATPGEQQQEQVPVSRDQPRDCYAAAVTSPTNGTRQPAASSRLSAVKVCSDNGCQHGVYCGMIASLGVSTKLPYMSSLVNKMGDHLRAGIP